jgi:hypothetical protein
MIWMRDFDAPRQFSTHVNVLTVRLLPLMDIGCRARGINGGGMKQTGIGGNELSLKLGRIPFDAICRCLRSTNCLAKIS